MEAFASRGGMLPEQVWDDGDGSGSRARLGRPTGSAMPLMWAHAEYVKLLRSVRDGVVFDRIPAVADRYLADRGRKDLEVWKLRRLVRSVPPGSTLRVQDVTPFRLRFSLDGWRAPSDAAATALGIHYADVPVPATQRTPVHFTFFWPDAGRWEGRDFQVGIETRGR